MSFNINKMLVLIDRYQFLNFSSDSLVKSLSKNDFKCQNQKFHNNVLDLVKQKGFYTYEYMRGFGKFKEGLSSKERFYSSSTGTKFVTMNMNLRFRISLKIKAIKDYHDLYLKCDFSLTADIFRNFRNNITTMIENEKTSFANISILFLRLCSQH